MLTLSRLFRLSLVCLAAYGAYHILAEYRFSQACRLEIERIDASFNKLLTSSNWPYVKVVNGGQYQSSKTNKSSLTSWLYYVPADKSITILHVAPDMSESILLEIPASEKEQRGRLYVQLSVQPEGSKVEFFGTESLIATFNAVEKSKVELNEISDLISSTMDNGEIFKTSWPARIPRWRPVAVGDLECSNTQSIVLCKWVEEEFDENSALIERHHALKIICK